MRENLFKAWLMLALLLVVTGLALSQAVQQNLILIINGQPGHAPLLQVNGRSYVDVEALARLTNGSLGFSGNQITLTLPSSAAPTQRTGVPVDQPTNPGFTKDFLKAGIEEMAMIREWRSSLLNLVQNGYPVSDELVASYRGQATTALRMASVAASTDSDRNAFQLLSSVFDKMQRLSNKLVASRKNMNYIAPNALQDDPIDQQILSCARSLAAMAASGQFQDDGSCH